MRINILLSSESLSEAQRWKLVSSLYDQVRSMLEGSLMLLATLGLCVFRTNWWGFWALAGVMCAVTFLRLLHLRRFLRARAARSTGSPEAWALEFVLGMFTVAALWAVTVVCVIFRFHDIYLLMCVILVQNGWLASAGVRNAASPLAIAGQTLITVAPTVLATFFGTSDLARLLSVAYLIFTVAMLKLARFYGRQMLTLMESEQSLVAANEQLLKLSCTDGLTGIANRRAFDDRIAADWALAVRRALHISVVIVDVDHFKLYNDRYGHLAGDDCLRAVAGHVAASVLRASDLPARYGGEEFVILLPNNDDKGAAVVAERLRKAVYDANLPHEASPLGRVTVSVGVAAIMPRMKDLPATLVTLADQALYEAKKGGRNQVCLAAQAVRADCFPA